MYLFDKNTEETKQERSLRYFLLCKIVIVGSSSYDCPSSQQKYAISPTNTLGIWPFYIARLLRVFDILFILISRTWESLYIHWQASEQKRQLFLRRLTHVETSVNSKQLVAITKTEEPTQIYRRKVLLCPSSSASAPEVTEVSQVLLLIPRLTSRNRCDAHALLTASCGSARTKQHDTHAVRMWKRATMSIIISFLEPASSKGSQQERMGYESWDEQEVGLQEAGDRWESGIAWADEDDMRLWLSQTVFVRKGRDVFLVQMRWEGGLMCLSKIRYGSTMKKVSTWVAMDPITRVRCVFTMEEWKGTWTWTR